MLKCWQEEPSARPSFKELTESLQQMNDVSDEKVGVQSVQPVGLRHNCLTISVSSFSFRLFRNDLIYRSICLVLYNLSFCHPCRPIHVQYASNL